MTTRRQTHRRGWMVDAASAVWESRAERVVRLAPWGAVAFSAIVPVMDVVTSWTREGAPQVFWVAGITACYLPWFLMLVLRTARAETSPGGGGWWLALLVIASIASGPLGAQLSASTALGVAALLLVRMPWALLFAVVPVVARAITAVVRGEDLGPVVWFTVSLVWAVAAVYSVALSAGAMTRIRSIRATLADRAVRDERSRVDQQLEDAVGGELRSISADGERAAELVPRDPERARAILAASVVRSRAALADVRRVIATLSRSSLQDELDTAVSLLKAAGMRTRIDGQPRSDATVSDGKDVGADLRVALAELLADANAVGTTVIVDRVSGVLSADQTEREG